MGQAPAGAIQSAGMGPNREPKPEPHHVEEAG